MAANEAAIDRVLVISSCTGAKVEASPNERTLDDFKAADRLATREAELSQHIRPAGEMYAGEQHTKMMDGVAAIRTRFGRDAVTVNIVSAGYGLIEESRPIAP